MRTREIPRWKRNRQYVPAAPVVMSGRQARKYARQGMTIYPPGAPAPVPGAPPQAATPAVTGSGIMRKSGGFRFRLHLVPFAWLAVMLAEGLAFPLAAAIVSGLITAALTVLLSWHLSPFARKASHAAAFLTAVWVPLLAAEGWTVPLPPVFIITWGLVLAAWVDHYRWRPSPVPEPVSSDIALWNTHLAARRLKGSWLADREPLPSGRRWTVMLPPGELEPQQVMSAHALIAGVWDKPLTEVFTEPYPDGRQSRCHLTILDRDTLATVTEWDGTGIGADGIGSPGRFADGSRARVRLFVRRDGTKHGLLAGTTGAGKTWTLDLLVRLALACPFPIVPVVLDPQEGQSLPYWRDKVIYAAGVDECMAMLRGLHAGMYDRSRYLGDLRWDDDGHEVRGQDFYDPELSGLPVVMVIMDEAPVLLTDSTHGRDAVSMLAQMAKLARKTGLSLWPVAQVPLIAELGDQVIRSMLRGGNVICLRTGDRVSAGALGLEADPSVLPAYFADGSPTAGLGYLLGPDQRQAPFRADLVPAKFRHAGVAVPTLDARFAAAMETAMQTVPRAPAALTVVPPPDDDAPDGRKAVDAVWMVLDRHGGKLNRGEILGKCAALVTEEWGRERPFAVRSIQDALTALTESGRIVNPAHGIYHVAHGGNRGQDAPTAGG